MNYKLRKIFLSAALAGTASLTAMPAGYAQNPADPAPGSNADAREDSHEVQALQSRIEQDKLRLADDQQQFGRRSPQARSDHQRLKNDRRALKQMRRGIKHDRKMRQRHHAV